MFNTKYKVGDKILVEYEIVSVEGVDGFTLNYRLSNPVTKGECWLGVSDLDLIDKTPKDQKKQRLQQQIEQMQAEIQRKQKEMEEM